MKGLRFFTRCSDRSLNLFTYHDPRSLTWSRLMSWYRAYKPQWGIWWNGHLFGPKTVIVNLGPRSLSYKSQTKMLLSKLRGEP